MEKSQLQLIFSVSDFIAVVNQTFEYAYPSVEIEGEVASFKVNQGKFVFFDIKDSTGSISCFMTVWQLRVPIEDGMKVIVCKVKDNPLGYTSVAYPVDELRLPKWFQELPFNHAEMETTIINNKLDNLIGVLEWDLESTTQENTFGQLFSFD